MDGIVEVITGIIGTLLYPLFSIIFLLIDAIQDVFYSFAGISDASFDGNPITSGVTGAENDQGLVYYLLQQPLVKNMIISMMILGLFLIVIFTTLAFIKNMYAAKPKGWKEIISSSIKGLFNFIFLPVCVLLGVWGGNILLKAINGATSAGGSATMARKLFISCAYNANIFRNSNGGINNGWSGYDKNATREDNAYNKIMYFANHWKLADDLEIEKGQSLEYYANIVDKMYSYDRVFLGSHVEVGWFYNLFQINYIVLIVGGIFMLYVLGSLSFAMVKRLFYILILFIISPGVCSLYPIDDGNAVKSWSGEVKKQVLSAYGAVAGLNIFFSLVPLVDKISIYSSTNILTSGWGMNDIIQIFILVSGLLVVKDIIGLISGFVGGDNAYATGSSLMKSSTDAVKKHVGGAAKNVTGAFATAKAKADFDGTGKKGLLKNLAKNAALDGLHNVTGAIFGVNAKDLKKHYKDAYKGVKDKAKADKDEAAAKEMAKEFKPHFDALADKFADIFTNAEGNEEASFNGEVIAEAIKQGSFYGVDEAKVVAMINEHYNAKNVKSSIPEIKKAYSEYKEAEEEAKMQRMAAYNANGKKYESQLDANVVNIKAAESKVEAAKANLTNLKTKGGMYDTRINTMQADIESAKQGIGRSGHKKGDTQQARKKAVSEMERIIESGETESTLDPSKFTGAFKDAIANFNKHLESASESIKKVAEATEQLGNAEKEKANAQQELITTISDIQSEFGDLSGTIKDLDKVTEKTADELAEMSLNIKKEMRK